MNLNVAFLRWTALSLLLTTLLTGCATRQSELVLTQDGWRILPLVSGSQVHSDWVMIGYGKMVVEEGALRTEPDPRGLGLLVYKKEKLGNCQIKVVFKPKDERANAGIYVRIADGILEQTRTPGAPFNRDASGKISADSMAKSKVTAEQEQGPWFAVHRGFEVQIAGGGDPWHRTGAIYSLAPSKAEIVKPGQWQTMLITLEGDRITVDLDGQRTSTFDSTARDLPARKQWHEPKREPKRPQVGYIGLQTHDPGDVVWFKEVSVRKLN